MKKFAKIMSVLFASILAVSVFAFAEDAEEEKTYIVYPKETVSLFSAEGESPRYMVIGEEELNLLLEEAPEMIDWYEENTIGKFCDSVLEEFEIYKDVDIYKYELAVVDAAAAWYNKLYGDDIVVAVIDSGIDTDNQEFESCYKGRHKDYFGTGIEDSYSHGTEVIGMIAAAHDGYGMKGIAPNVEIIPMKVSDTENVEAEKVAQAVAEAINMECDVINLSLSFSSENQTLKNAIDEAVNAGIIVVAAVGNYEKENDAEKYNELIFKEDNSLGYPAAYENVIGVGSVHKLYGHVDDVYGLNKVSKFSKKNKSVHIVAPGEEVITTIVDDEYSYAYLYGTSLAAPLVTGAVALIKQAKPDLTPAEIMDILEESARDDSKGDGYDTSYGHGVLNVAAAIELALGHEMLAPDTVTYTISAKDSKLNGAVMVEDYINGYIGLYPLGESFTANAEPTYMLDGTEYKFAYWENGNGTHVSGDATYTFNATSNFTLYAVYDEVVADESATTEKKVEFWNGNGIWLDTAEVDTTTGKASIPEKAQNPTMTGYAFDGWLDEDEKEFTAESVLEKNFTRVVAQFKDAVTEYSITFDDIEEDTTRTGKYGDAVEYTATGNGFDYWKLGEKIVSYNPSIEIALWGEDKTLTAVYDAENFDVKPTVVLDEGADGADFLIYAVPEGYEIVDAGIVFGTEGSTPRVASFNSKASVKKLPENAFGQFTSLPGSEEHTKARGYLIYKDTNNVTRVIYAD